MLGRWKITHEPKAIQSKVDWVNVDHYGCCHMDSNDSRRFSILESMLVSALDTKKKKSKLLY